MSEKKLRASLALGYIIVGLALAAGVAGAVLGIANWNGKASKASVSAVAARVDPSKEKAVKAACTYAVSQAAASGLIASSCTLSKDKGAYTVKGDDAQVKVDVLTDQARFVLVIVLNKGVWQAQGLNVIKATPTKK
jgi:hypothetical protein